MGVGVGVGVGMRTAHEHSGAGGLRLKLLYKSYISYRASTYPERFAIILTRRTLFLPDVLISIRYDYSPCSVLVM